MNTTKAKRNPRKPTKRRWPRPAAPRLRTKTFKDGSAVILDQRGGIIGLIEARMPYRVRRRAQPRPLANSHR